MKSPFKDFGYRPNFNDPRTIARVKYSIDHVSRYLYSSREKQHLSTSFRAVFGNSSLGEYIKRHLVECTDQYYSKDEKIAKKYVFRPEGIKSLAAKIGLEWAEPTLEFRVEQAKIRYAKEIDDINAGRLEYADKSDRYFNPIQNIPSDERKILLARYAGMVNDYDVQASAPTLLIQHARQLGFTLSTPAIDQYLEDRSKIRKHISKATGIDLDTVKTIVNAVFAGSKIGCNPYFMIFDLVGSKQKIDKLRNLEYVKQLRMDISNMWKYIISIDSKFSYREYKKDSSGKMRRVPIKSGQKWRLYFFLERKVLDTMLWHCVFKNHSKFVREHDGWRTNKHFSSSELESVIYDRLGFKLKIEHKVYDTNGTLIATNPTSDNITSLREDETSSEVSTNKGTSRVSSRSFASQPPNSPNVVYKLGPQFSKPIPVGQTRKEEPENVALYSQRYLI